MKIEPCRAIQILASGLLEAYAGESAINGMPRPLADAPAYERLESTGALCCIGAFDDNGAMTGFATLITSPLPHYGGARVTIVESIFVAQAHRKTGAGTMLIRAAEQKSRHDKTAGVLISAPYGGALDAMLGRSRRYRRTNSIYFRGRNEA